MGAGVAFIGSKADEEASENGRLSIVLFSQFMNGMNYPTDPRQSQTSPKISIHSTIIYYYFHSIIYYLFHSSKRDRSKDVRSTSMLCKFVVDFLQHIL